jgi:shingomyelin synthase
VSYAEERVAEAGGGSALAAASIRWERGGRMGEEELVLIVQAEGEEAAIEAPDLRRKRAPHGNSSRGDYSVVATDGERTSVELAAEDAVCGVGGAAGGRVSAVSAAAASRLHQTHSRGSSGASVKYVASETSSSADGASVAGHHRTLSGVSAISSEGEARVIILSPSPVGGEEVEEAVRKRLDPPTEDPVPGRMPDNNNSKGYGSFRSTPVKSTPKKASSSLARREGSPGRSKPLDDGDGGGDGGEDANERLIAASPADGVESTTPVSRGDSCHMVRSDSCSSDDEMGANSSGYMRRKPRKRGRGGGGDVHLDMEEDEVDACQQRQELSGEIPKEMHKTLVAFLFFFFGAVATTTSLALAHERVPEEDPLPDVFLDNVSYQDWGLDVSEVTIMAASMSTFALCLFHGSRFVVLRRVFFLGGLHYLYRAITMYVTVLPKPDSHYTCVPKADNLTFVVVAQRVLKLLSGVGLTINGEHVYCGDYIYSGHTMTLVMTYLIVKEYSPQRWYLLHWLSWSVAAFGIAVLLLARGHYSIDVVIAYWITTRLWWIYHTMANNPSLIAKENSENFLNRFWWWPIFQYLEGNIGRPLPRTYNWPLPKVVVVRARETWLRLKARRESSSERDGSSEPALPNASAAAVITSPESPTAAAAGATTAAEEP